MKQSCKGVCPKLNSQNHTIVLEINDLSLHCCKKLTVIFMSTKCSSLYLFMCKICEIYETLIMKTLRFALTCIFYFGPIYQEDYFEHAVWKKDTEVFDTIFFLL